MSVSSTCEVCSAGDVDHTCDRCGQLVCDDHFDETVGFCVECAADVTGPADPGSVADTDHDDVHTNRF